MEELFLPRTEFENYEDFFKNYKMLRHIIFSSDEFSGETACSVPGSASAGAGFSFFFGIKSPFFEIS